MKRRVLSVLLVLALVISAMTGCSKNTGEKTGNEVVTLKWIVVGSGMPSNYDAWQKNINKYLEDKIGVNIDVEVISWGDWGNRRNLAVTSGEYYDILFTDSGRYMSEVKLGAFLDISELVKTATPELYNYIPTAYWDAVRVGGKIYSVPTYKDSSATQYMVWDKAVAEKYNIDINNSTTFASLSEKFEEIKNAEGTSPVVLDKNGFDVILSVYDQMGAELPALGVRYDDKTRTVVNVLEQPEIVEQLELFHDWYQKGIINADAPTLDETPSYRMFFTAQGWSGAAKTTWGPKMGVDAEAIKFIDSIVSNTTVRGSLNAIYSGCKYPEKALQFIQLMNTDSYVRDSFYYGLEGENFKYTADKKIEKLNSEWTMAGYTQGTFFKVSQLADDEFNQWEEVKELNDKATGSVLLGFDFDTKDIETELANCREVYNKYKSTLLTGAEEPKALIAKITEELKAAGFEKVMAEAQKQINEMFK